MFGAWHGGSPPEDSPVGEAEARELRANSRVNSDLERHHVSKIKSNNKNS